MASASVAGAFIFLITIYFTQTLNFYQMPSKSSKQGNNVKTLYSHDSYITKRYKRNVAKTYFGTINFPGITTRDSNTVTSVTFHDASYYPSPKSQYILNSSSDLDWIKMNTLWDDTKALTSNDFIEWAIKNKQLKKFPEIYDQYYQPINDSDLSKGEISHDLPNSALAVQKNFNIDLTQSGYVVTGFNTNNKNKTKSSNNSSKKNKRK